MIGPNKILIDKEKALVNDQEAYRLYFFDEQSGQIVKVISYVAPNDVHLNKIQDEITPTISSPKEELQNAVRQG